MVMRIPIGALNELSAKKKQGLRNGTIAGASDPRGGGCSPRAVPSPRTLSMACGGCPARPESSRLEMTCGDWCMRANALHGLAVECRRRCETHRKAGAARSTVSSPSWNHDDGIHHARSVLPLRRRLPPPPQHARRLAASNGERLLTTVDAHAPTSRLPSGSYILRRRRSRSSAEAEV